MVAGHVVVGDSGFEVKGRPRVSVQERWKSCDPSKAKFGLFVTSVHAKLLLGS